MQYTLLPFQEKEIAPLYNHKRGGLCWDMGLGKTGGVCSIGSRRKLRRWLVICPDNAVSVWSKWSTDPERPNALDWIKNFWPEIKKITVNVLSGEPQYWRNQIWPGMSLGENEIQIIVCTIETFMRDWVDTIKVAGKKKKQVRFKARKDYWVPNIVILDEAKKIRNPDSIGFQALDKFVGYYNPEYFYPMTGTPGHTPKDYWSMLHLIDRKKFPSYWQFVMQFHEVIDGFWGKEVLGPRNLEIWYKVLGRYFSVVKEDDEGIAEQRPPLTRQLLSIQMDEDQRKVYEDLHKEMMHFVEADDNLVIAQNEFVQNTRLRQALICPKILSPSLGVGAAIKDFAENNEPEEGPYVIFTPFTSTFGPFTDYLSTKGFRVQTLQGSIGSDERDDRISLWRQERGVCICSVLYAQAFSLEPATRCYFIGYDWDPDNNRQAEKRLHRLTSPKPISAYYYTYRSTFDEKLCAIVNIKQVNVNQTSPQNLRTLIHGDVQPKGC